MKQKQNRLQKDILFISISSFIVIVAWIGFNIYHIYVTTTVSQDLQVQLTPINPGFDTQTIQQLKSRENINPAFALPKVAATPTPSLPNSTVPTPPPLISGVPNVTTQNSSVASRAALPTQSNSPINKAGQ